MQRPSCEVDRDALDAYRSDLWAFALMRARAGDPLSPPEAAFRPRSTSEVAECIRWAAESGLGVVARGGGSGVCGAAVPGERTAVIDLTALDELHVDATNMVVRSGAGVYGPRLEEELNAHEMTLGHVPQSFHLSTVGGWIATKAIGQLSTRYGGIEDMLLGLTAVLADGQVVSNRPVPRSSAGPEWWRLFVGAEGTLGIVTEAVMSAQPLPAHSKWLEIGFPSLDEGMGFARAVMIAGLRPSVARIYDGPDASLNFGAKGITSPIGIFRFEGTASMVEAEHAVATRLATGHAVLEAGAGPHWWEHRFRAADTYKQILAGQGALGPLGVVDTLEVAAFWSELPGVYRAITDSLEGKVDLLLAHSSHLYMSGANIYFTFLISSAQSEADAEARYRAAWRAAGDAAVSMGATVSHHHGIGLLKAPWLAAEWGEGAAANRAVKQALDPDGRMNPGKLF